MARWSELLFAIFDSRAPRRPPGHPAIWPSRPPARGQHSHAEPEPPSAGESGRDAGCSKGARQREQRAPCRFPREDPKEESCDRGEPPRAVEQLPRRLETASISHARWADWLAPAATQARVEVLHESRVICRKLTPLERPHEHDPAARAVRLVTGREIRRAGWQTKPAVDARIERRERTCARTHTRTRTRLSSLVSRPLSLVPVTPRCSPGRPPVDVPDRRFAGAGPPGGPRLRDTHRSGRLPGAPPRARARA